MPTNETLRVVAVGDTRLRTPSNVLRDPERVKQMQTWTGAGEIAIANLETALTRRGARADKLAVMRSDPSLIREIKHFGFGVVTLANNHVMDYGHEGLEDTLQAVDAAGLARVGAGRGWDEAVRPWRATLPGERQVHVLNWCCTLGPGAAAGDGVPGVAPLRVTQRLELDPIFEQEQPGTAPWVETYVREQDLRASVSQVAAAKAAGGWVIVCIHWGVPPHWQAPFQGWLATYQRPLARRLVEAGADVILGHHPHVLHGVEIIKGRPVFYSLGNFFFHPRAAEESKEVKEAEPGYRLFWKEALAISGADERKRESVVLQMEWRRNSWSARLEPAWLDECGEPVAAQGQVRERILARLQEMSRQVGTTVEVRDGGAHVTWEP